MSNSPKTITHMESNQLLHYLTDCTGFRGGKPLNLRNLTITLFMLDAGLRVSEVSSLLWTDCFVGDVPVNNLFLDAQITKTKTSRTVPLSDRLKRALIAYFPQWHTNLSVGYALYLFYSTGYQTPLSSRQIERMIKRASLLSFGRPIHPHVLRHTFATRLMRKVNARIVQELLGHKNLASTQIYSHPNNDDLTEAIKLIE